MRTIMTSLLCLLTASAPAAGQVLRGVVIDSTAGARVATAEVMLFQKGERASVLTDSLGRFRIEARPGAFLLRVRAFGYGDVLTPALTVGPRDTVDVTVLLGPAPLAMAALAVNARFRTGLAGFHERRLSGRVGIFIDSVQVQRNPTLTHLLRRIPFADVTENSVSLRQDCSDAIYVVDGLPVLAGTFDITGHFAPQDIAAIEVYRSDVGVPADFLPALFSQPSGSSRCGIIAIWLKR